MRIVIGVFLIACILCSLSSGVSAVTPGVDIAVPRVAITTVDGVSFMFHPAQIAVEQGDWVQWAWTGGSHTTTSGSGCIADNLWHAPLNSLSPPQFTRQFLEPPGSLPFFCMPHCTFGMVGNVAVSTLIDLTAQNASGTLTLSWIGGSGSYRVFRSDTPAFTGTGTVILTPSGGTTQMSISDTAQPPPGSAAFYLVMNQF
jgi:plastocyanin